VNLQFFDSYPYHTLEPDLQALVLAARRLDAAVAFVRRVEYSVCETSFNCLRRCKP
jgi:hypothetical protein